MSRKRDEDKKKFRTSAMKGRRISLEDRGPDAKKLGRKFKYAPDNSERSVVTLILKKGDMDKFLKKVKAKSKAKAIADMIEKEIA